MARRHGLGGGAVVFSPFRPAVRLCGVGGCVEFELRCHRVTAYTHRTGVLRPRVHVSGSRLYALEESLYRALEELERGRETVWLGLIARFECTGDTCSIHADGGHVVAQVPRGEIVEALSYLVTRSRSFCI